MIKLFRILIVFLLFFNYTTKTFSNDNIKIKIKINNEIVTNFDLKREKDYLIALNPNLKELKNELQNKIAKDSIVREVIKKNEVKKFFNLNQKNEMINIFIKRLYTNLGFVDELSFENYLVQYNWTINEVKKKIEIESLWNQLIYEKYRNQVKIDEIKLKEKVKNDQKNDFKILYNLSEIVFVIEKNKTYENTIKSIDSSIIEIGFENTANLYSVSESSNVGGKIGWVDSNSLSSNLINSIKNLKIGEYTKPVKIGSRFIILKINDVKNEKKIIDKEKELKNLIKIEENRQLNNFSKIYFDKLQINTKINEF
jgi:peptidyl-prolyl cis-trans isomerase SurA